MRLTLNLSQAAEMVGTTPAILAAELRRGSIPGIAASAGNPGSAGRHFTLEEIIRIALFFEMRALSVGSKVLGQRAAEVARNNVVVEAIRGRLAGVARTLGAVAIMGFPDRNEQVLYVGDERSLAEMQIDAVRYAAHLQTIALLPVANRIAAAIAKANGIDLPALTKAALEAATAAPTMPSAASGEPPPETGLYRTSKAADVSGILAGPAGLEILHRGQGLGFKLKPEHWRELARRAEAIADEMEGRPPRAEIPAAWQIAAGDVAGNA